MKKRVFFGNLFIGAGHVGGPGDVSSTDLKYFSSEIIKYCCHLACRYLPKQVFLEKRYSP